MNDKNLTRRFGSLLVFAAATTLLGAGTAIAVTPQTLNGVAYASGGGVAQERGELQGMRNDYSLFLKVSSKNEPYVDPMRRVKIVAGRNVVFESKMEGPWLLVNLPAGSYSVSVVSEGKSKVLDTRIGNNDHRELSVVWDVDGQK